MALGDIRIRVKADTSQAEAGLDRVEDGLKGVGQGATFAKDRVSEYSRRLNATTFRQRRFGMGVQNVAFQLGDFATQVGSGTSASIALGQQLPQLLGGFGALGAVLGAVVAVGIPLARGLSAISESGRDLSIVLGELQFLAPVVSSALRALRDITVQTAEVILNNLDRIIVVAGVAASAFAVKLVGGMILARAATFSLAGALTFLRGALIRTGIGIIVVALGEAVFRFIQLTKAAGGFGQAVSLLSDVFKETFDRIKAHLTILKTNFQLILNDMLYAWTVGVGEMQVQFAQMIDSIAESAPTWMGFVGGNADQARREVADRMRGITDDLIGILDEKRAAEKVLEAPRVALESLREVLRSIRDENLDLESLFAGGAVTAEDGGEGGGRGTTKSAFKAMIEQIEATRRAYEGLRQAGQGVFSALGDFVQQFAGKSRAAAIAAIAIQKGLSIAQIIANTAAAQMRALAELGPIAGPPVAAKIGAYGKIQAALVAATGLVQAFGGGGTGPNLSGTGPGPGSATPETGTTTAVTINLRGQMFGREAVLGLIEQINEAVGDGARIRGV